MIDNVSCAPTMECTNYECLDGRMSVVDWTWAFNGYDDYFNPDLTLSIEFTWKCNICGRKTKMDAVVGRLG